MYPWLMEAESLRKSLCVWKGAHWQENRQRQKQSRWWHVHKRHGCATESSDSQWKYCLWERWRHLLHAWRPRYRVFYDCPAILPQSKEEASARFLANLSYSRRSLRPIWPPATQTFTPVGNMTLEFSLIGDNPGSRLDEAHTADSNRNLVGSAAGYGIIDAKLGELGDNGGTTPTHVRLGGKPSDRCRPGSSNAAD